MPVKQDIKKNNAPKMTSQELTQKAAGYMLAAANAAKAEAETKKKPKK
jgi:hypothetical protein